MSWTPGRAHTPLKSGLPLGSRGAGAFMSTLARADCAAAVPLSTTRRPIAHTDVLMTELLSGGPKSGLWAGWGRRSTPVLESGSWSLVPSLVLCPSLVLSPWCVASSRLLGDGPRTMDHGRTKHQAPRTKHQVQRVPQARRASRSRASARRRIAASSVGAKLQSRGWPRRDLFLRPMRAHQPDRPMRRRGEQQMSELVRDRAAEQHAAVGARLVRQPHRRDRNRSSPARRRRSCRSIIASPSDTFPVGRSGTGDRTIRMASSPGAKGALHDGLAGHIRQITSIDAASSAFRAWSSA